MNVETQFRAELTKLSQPLVEEFDQQNAAISATFEVEHYPDGTHKKAASPFRQVVFGSYSTETSSASSTYADTGLQATIRPQSPDSQIAIFVLQASVVKTASDTHITIRLLRGSTQIALVESGGGHTASTAENGCGACGALYIDQPHTDQPVTYKTQFKSEANSSGVTVQNNGASSGIILMEIRPA